MPVIRFVFGFKNLIESHTRHIPQIRDTNNRIHAPDGHLCINVYHPHELQFCRARLKWAIISIIRNQLEYCTVLPSLERDFLPARQLSILCQQSDRGIIWYFPSGRGLEGTRTDSPQESAEDQYSNVDIDIKVRHANVCAVFGKGNSAMQWYRFLM